MPSHTAFLRAINVGGRRVTADALCAPFAELGLTDVAAYQASGNVVFTSSGGGGAGGVAKRVEEGLLDALGYEVPVFLRTGAEVRRIAGHELFPARAVRASTGKLQVALLPKTPTAAGRRKALAMATGQDPLAVRGRELYWLPSGGVLDSEVDLKALEKLVGPWTMRTQGTIERIAAKFFAMPAAAPAAPSAG